MPARPHGPDNNTDRFTINDPRDIKMLGKARIVDHRTPEQVKDDTDHKEALRRARETSPE